MLIRFTVTNFLSFKDETEFSMIPAHGAGKTRHVIKSESRNGISVLQSGIIYGANASGKSNLFKAISCAKEIIINPLDKDLPLPDSRFKLNKKTKPNATKFEFEIKCNEKYYAYGFSFTPERIVEEWLYQIDKNKEKEIFTRKGLKPKLNPKAITAGKEYNRLSFIADDLFDNQLFLTMVNNRNISDIKSAESFMSVYLWIKDSLIIIFPESEYIGTPVWGMQSDLSKAFDRILSGFDTGIKRTAFIDISSERLYEKIPMHSIEDFKSKIWNGKEIIISAPSHDKFLISMDSDKELKVKELVTYHDDSDIYFTMSEESDGTNRLTDLLPAFSNFVIKKEAVVLIDELDRSLHPELSYRFMELFFNFTDNKNIQLIISTHDTGLLDQKLFRKDEVWFIEKNQNGISEIYSLAQFKPRDDLNLQKGYLNGRFGAIPFFGNTLDTFREDIKE